jgi:hypothetical protein
VGELVLRGVVPRTRRSACRVEVGVDFLSRRGLYEAGGKSDVGSPGSVPPRGESLERGPRCERGEPPTSGEFSRETVRSALSKV